MSIGKMVSTIAVALTLLSFRPAFLSLMCAASPRISSLSPSAFNVQYPPLNLNDSSSLSPFNEAYYLLKNNYINRHCISDSTWASWKRECSTQRNGVSALLQKTRDPFALYMDRNCLARRMSRVDGRSESSGITLKRVWRGPFSKWGLSKWHLKHSFTMNAQYIRRVSPFHLLRNLFTEVVIDSVVDGYQRDSRLVTGSTVLAIGCRPVTMMSETELRSVLPLLDEDTMKDNPLNITILEPTIGRGKQLQYNTICIPIDRLSLPTESTVIFAVKPPLFHTHHKLYTRGATGYLTISHFSGESVSDTRKAIEEIRRQLRTVYNTSLRSLVIDLRGNRGGSLLAAVDLAALFLPYGSPIVQLISNGTTSIYRSLNDGADVTTPILIIIDVNTASASEVFTAALCESGRASSAGWDHYTTGKNVVQMITSLNDSSGICFTIKEWRSPGGRDMSKGLTPTYALPAVRCVAHESSKQVGNSASCCCFSAHIPIYWLDYEKQWAWGENITSVYALKRFNLK